MHNKFQCIGYFLEQRAPQLHVHMASQCPLRLEVVQLLLAISDLMQTAVQLAMAAGYRSWPCTL